MNISKFKRGFIYVNCDFCASDDFTVRYVKNGFNIVQCNNCRLVFVNPRLDSDKVVSLYDENYFGGRGFDNSIDYRKEFEENADKLSLIDWDLSAARNMIEQERDSTREIKFLDVGAGMGLALYKAAKKGFDSVGLEVSKYACSFAESKKLKVINGTLEGTEFGSDKFDIIFMREVIEHLESPVSALNKVFALLDKGGVLFITTGNYDCPERKVKGKNWHYFMPEGHLNIFTPETLGNYLNRAGFRNVAVTNQGDLMMNFLIRMKIIETDKYKPTNFLKRVAFESVRFVNHFISSGIRAYAVK